MKICIECGRQLFEYDKLCDKCNSNNIISEEGYNEIIKEIKHANIFTKKKLLQNHDYKCVYDRLQCPPTSHPKPEILKNDDFEYDKEYWERINRHTINKNVSIKLTVECPYCNSKDTKKITDTSKAVHIALFGIFSVGRNTKNFHCNQCGADF